MPKPSLYIFILILTGISFVCRAQYTGGVADGGGSGNLSGSVCTLAANSNIYFGGIEDGGSYSALAASTCAAAANANIYFGGVQDGFSSGSLTVSVCPPPPNANIYFGGVEDGFSKGVLSVSVCPVQPNSNIYFGGVEDGFSTGALIPNVCPIQPNGNIYFGGIQDGFSWGNLIVSVCPVPQNANIYFGGVQDGFSTIYLKSLLATCLLQIELASFTGTCTGQAKMLNWSTASEINNDLFTIEYSPDGANWQVAGTVKGVGNSSTPTRYTFTDPVYRSGLSYYKIKQTDLDGHSTYSTILTIGSCTPDPTDKLSVYPNPSPGLLLLSFDGDRTKVQSIDVYNVLGEIVYHSAAFKSRIDLGDNAAGTYFIHFTLATGTVIREILIKK